MRPRALGHRDVGGEARAQLDALFKAADRRQILVVDGRQLLPRAALRGDVAGRIPLRQALENVAVVRSDDVSDCARLVLQNCSPDGARDTVRHPGSSKDDGRQL